ncbi:MAG: hypothetical protein ACRDZ5_09345 [Acidimicrobiales bacterium]
MKVLAAMVIGYLLGAKSGAKDLDQLSRALKALYETDELADVVAAGRMQLGASLRGLAGILDGQPDAAGAGDLVTRVRSIVGRD